MASLEEGFGLFKKARNRQEFRRVVQVHGAGGNSIRAICARLDREFPADIGCVYCKESLAQ